MSTISPPQKPEENPRVKTIFDDIRATRGSDFINNLWHYLAFDVELLEITWRDVKAIMAKPSNLDPMTKEQLVLKISREIHRGKGKLESFHGLQCIRSYFYDLSMDDLEGIAGQYGINI